MKNLDPEKAKMRLEVILENHDIFSRDKSDLGKTDIMEHEIWLKDDSTA